MPSPVRIDDDEPREAAMKKEELLAAFAELTREEQKEIREELGGDPLDVCSEIMQRVGSGESPMAICKEMKEKIKKKCCV